jgi:hypothetical protein
VKRRGRWHHVCVLRNEEGIVLKTGLLQPSAAVHVEKAAKERERERERERDTASEAEHEHKMGDRK